MMSLVVPTKELEHRLQKRLGYVETVVLPYKTCQPGILLVFVIGSDEQLWGPVQIREIERLIGQVSATNHEQVTEQNST